MKKITLILILVATFAIKSFAHCPIPQWCPDAPLHQTLCPGEQIEEIEFPSVIGRTLIINWWTDGTRFASINTPPGIIISGPPENREHSAPVIIRGAPTAIGTHHYTVSNTCGVELLHGSITVAGPPIIGTVTPTIDQATPQNIAFDSTLTLTADPVGSMPPITIQWFSNTTATNSGGINLGSANGAQTNTFTPPTSATVNLSGVYYYAVATDGCGRTVTTTNTSGKHIVVPACTPWVGETGCNNNALTFTLGTPYFASNETWIITGSGFTQEWSDVVRAPGCAKGNTSNSNAFANDSAVADCRQARQPDVGFHGHYYSWCMVHRFASQLCPPGDGWRVPTCQDFVNLDVALGGNGIERYDTVNGVSITDQFGWYTHASGGGGGADAIPTPGGIWGGSRYTSQAITLTGVYSIYWSSSMRNATHSHNFSIRETGGHRVFPMSWNPKGSGLALRCVRDVP